MSQTLLPPNASPLLRAQSLSAARTEAIAVPMRDLMNPDTCPAVVLPWLAWALSVDEWDPAWTEEDQRATLRESVGVHRRKGTLWSMRRAIINAGLGHSVIHEGDATSRYDGAADHDASITYGDGLEWASYYVALERPMTNLQADQVRRILGYTAPARCHLAGLDFTEVPNIYNGASFYDGAYNHGVA